MNCYAMTQRYIKNHRNMLNFSVIKRQARKAYYYTTGQFDLKAVVYVYYLRLLCHHFLSPSILQCQTFKCTPQPTYENTCVSAHDFQYDVLRDMYYNAPAQGITLKLYWYFINNNELNLRVKFIQGFFGNGEIRTIFMQETKQILSICNRS